ncbi:hypothetical protein [Vibrio sp. WXL103]|uniref:hypothetical protein n=1 Tax=Vibrio sp. WXL103 TaxID=3450710 RepID=UPI003EC5BE3B
MEIKKIAISVALALATTSCFNDDSSSSSDRSGSYTLSGSVIDGYIYNALVWIDANRNGELDESDPQAVTDINGTYSLNLTKAQADGLIGLPILAKLTNESVDVGSVPPESEEALLQLIEDGELDYFFSSDQTAHSVTLSMPPIGPEALDSLLNGELEGQVINPFTTEVYEDIADVLDGFVADAIDSEEASFIASQIATLVERTERQRMEWLKTQMSNTGDYDDEELLDLMKGDFIDSNHNLTNAMLEMAAIMVESKKQDEEKAQELASEAGDGATVIYRTVNGTDYFTPYNTTSPIAVTEKGYKQSVTQGNNIDFESKVDQFREVDDEDILYSTSTTTGAENTETGDYWAMASYSSDLNRDGSLNFSSFVYDIGTHTVEDGVSTYSTTKYIDEDDPYTAAYPYSVWEQDSGRVLTYGSVEEFVDAIKDDDLSGVDALQKMEQVSWVTSEYEFESREFTEYDHTGAEPFDLPTYRQINSYWNYFDGSKKEVISSDWGADGHINNTQVNEYDATTDIDYNSWEEITWGELYGGDFIDYWKDFTVFEYIDDEGSEIHRSIGGKYILDSDTNTKLLDDSDEGYLFNSWDYTLISYSESDQRDHVIWHNYKLEGYDFTYSGSGQKYTTEIDGKYTAYIEDWGPFITGLPSFVDGLIDDGFTEQEIWLRVINESLSSARAQEPYDECEIDIVGEGATKAVFESHLASCGGKIELEEENISGITIARRRSGGSAVRLWYLDPDGTAIRGDWEDSGETYKYDYNWSVNSDGHLVIERDTFKREIAAYYLFSGENDVYGGAMIVLDQDTEFPDEDTVWNTYFVDVSDVWIPYDVSEIE